MKTIPVSLPEDLPPALALVLFETLEHLTNAVWTLYERELIDLMMAAEHDPAAPVQEVLDFNDDLPF